MHPLIEHIKHRIQGKIPAGSKRSGKWPTVRAAHLEKFPNCSLCGGNKKIEVHHARPFHLHPELELDPNNLITLCEGNKSVNCHLAWGHLFSFRSFNPDVAKDVGSFRDKVLNRPGNAK